MSNIPSAWQIEQVMSAYMRAKSEIDNDEHIFIDEDQLADELGGWTVEVDDVLTRLIRAADYSRCMRDAAKERAEAVAARSERYGRRFEMLKSTALAIMGILKRDSFELPELTATRNKGRESADVTNADVLPDEYVVIKRQPDKAKILADLKVGVVIDGAALKPGTPSLTIRSV